MSFIIIKVVRKSAKNLSHVTRDFFCDPAVERSIKRTQIGKRKQRNSAIDVRLATTTQPGYTLNVTLKLAVSSAQIYQGNSRQIPWSSYHVDLRRTLNGARVCAGILRSVRQQEIKSATKARSNEAPKDMVFV